MNALIHGDCLKVMQQLPDESVDMILCDLPYGITHNEWDVLIPPEHLWHQWERICKKNAAIVLTAMQPFASQLIQSNPKMFRYEWIWEKSCAGGFLNAKRRPLAAHENILVFYKSMPTYHPEMRKGQMRLKNAPGGKSSNYGKFERKPVINDVYYPRSVLKVSNAKRGGETHPTAKPVELMRYMIRTYSNPGDTILDCCMGGGSTGIAAKLENRDFVGIEMDDRWFEIAQKNILSTQRS